MASVHKGRSGLVNVQSGTNILFALDHLIVVEESGSRLGSPRRVLLPPPTLATEGEQ